MSKMTRRSLSLACILTGTLGAAVIGIKNEPAVAGCNPFGCSSSSVAECNPFGCPKPPQGAECNPFGCPDSPQPATPPPQPPVIYPPPYPPPYPYPPYPYGVPPQPNYDRQAPRASAGEIADCVKKLMFKRVLICTDPDGTCSPFSRHLKEREVRTEVSENAAVQACTAGGR
jgi:hypothetical protein